VLGYASFQLEAAAKLARDAQVDMAVKQLDRVSNVIRGAHADVREYIFNLRSAPSQYQPFFTVLRQYLEGFSNNYEVQAHLNVAPTLNHKKFSADMQLQLFRIVQEALSNARNHGGAHQVELKFDEVDGRIYMIITDNGRGFSTDDLKTESGQHFGLQFMRERAAQLGGSLQVHSAPGKGTQVILEFPEKDL
jgi:signal transduction histidine kinase